MNRRSRLQSNWLNSQVIGMDMSKGRHELDQRREERCIHAEFTACQKLAHVRRVEPSKCVAIEMLQYSFSGSRVPKPCPLWVISGHLRAKIMSALQAKGEIWCRV